MRAVLALLLFACLLLASAARVGFPKVSPADVPRVCQEIETAPHSIASCADSGKVEEIVHVFREKTGSVPDAALPLNPVILLPGLGQSGLQASLHRETTPEWYCIKRWDWYEIWLDIYELLAQPCWLDNMQLLFYPNNNTYSNQTGVSIQPNDFGGLNGVNYLDHFDDPLHLTAVYATMISALEEIGYRPGVTLYGAPYDWRLPVDYMFHATTWDENLQALVETAYKNAGNRKVWFITHSMGGPTALYFMNAMGAAWVNEFIEGFIPIAGPWSGSPDALRAQVEGTNFGLGFDGFSVINLQSIAKIARQAGGVSYLLPDEFYWPADQVFVSTPSVNYTLGDLPQLFNDLGTPVALDIHEQTFQLMDKMAPPTVPTYCLYGYNISTLISLSYSEDFAGHGDNYVPPPGVRDMSDMGDGTVPLQSLQECKSWVQLGAPVNCKEYNLKKHSAITKDVEVLSDVLAILAGKSPIQGCSTSVLDSLHK